MSITITEQEYSKYYREAINAYTNAVYVHHAKRTYGVPTTLKERRCIKELKLILNCLSNWEQQEFSGSMYPNFINWRQMKAIFKRIEELK